MTPRRTVLLVHGMASSRRTWWRVGPQLETRGWDVTTVDLAGHGGRSVGTTGSLTDLADDVVAQHPDGPTLLVGHSLGAIVALQIAATRPAYARGLLLEDPPSPSARGSGGGRTGDPGDEALPARTDPHRAVEAILAGHPGWSRRDARSVLEGRLMTDPRVSQRISRDVTWDLPALVSASPLPLAVVAAAGRHSALHDPDRSELLRLLPPGRFREIRSGHHVHLDEPAEWVDAVESFGDSLL